MTYKRELPLPPAGSSSAMVTYRLEQIACAIQQSVQEKKAAAVDEDRLKVPLDAYAHFRRRSFEVLTHFIDNDFQAAFGWLLEMHAAKPQRSRGDLRGNDFHVGLLALTAAAGEFMHRNKLGDLAKVMRQAHGAGVATAEFNDFVAMARKNALSERVIVSPERGMQLAQQAKARLAREGRGTPLSSKGQ